MAASMINFDKVKQIFNVDDLEPFQKRAIENLMEGRDVFVSVKTGAGKSMCYQAFQPVWEESTGEKCIVLIVTPLVSIMREQCEHLNQLGFMATYIGRDASEDCDILCGRYHYVFASPEQLLSTPKWREMLLSSTGTGNKLIRLLAVDEAHVVLHWGEAEAGETAFRGWFGKLGEVRSLLECPILLITATANKSARTKLQRQFCMKDCAEIIDNPDRSNIKLFVANHKSTQPLDETFSFLTQSLKEQKQDCDRVIVFCTSIKTCSDLFTMLRLELGCHIRYVEMYHSSTTDSVKEDVKKDLANALGMIRVLIATSAAGMGVNFSGVTSVVNYGPPKDMDTFIQQIGRAGREGTQATAVLLYNAKQCKDLDSDMKKYVSNSSQCRRKVLLSAYNVESEATLVKHACCDICAKTCSCEVECPDIKHPYFEIASQNEFSNSSESDASDGIENLFSDSD